MKDVIALRKSCDGFRYATSKELKEHLSFEKLGNEVLLYTIKDTEIDGVACTLKVIINPSRSDIEIKSTSKCRCLLNENGACNLETDSLKVPELSVVVYQCY
ncbi:MAG: hypothetical protein IKV65_02380 [Erysipelotrichaceae bacterium]|nr:hypothetical protein [Erysipelotrichaceae bacterium]